MIQKVVVALDKVILLPFEHILPCLKIGVLDINVKKALGQVI